MDRKLIGVMTTQRTTESIEEEIIRIRRQLAELAGGQRTLEIGTYRQATGGYDHGNEMEDTNVLSHDDSGIIEGLAKASTAIDALGRQLEQLSGIERRLIALETVSSLRTLDFNIVDKKLNAAFLEGQVYHAAVINTKLEVDYYLGTETANIDHRWQGATYIDSGGGDGRIRTKGQFTKNMFHRLKGITRVYPGSVKFPVTFLRQKDWGVDTFATRMSGKGAQYPTTTDFYSEGSTYKTARACVLSYTRRAYKMREGRLTGNATAANAFSDLARYAGAGALAAIGAEFGAGGLFVANVLSEELFSVNINTLSTDLQALNDDFEEDSSNTIANLIDLAVTEFTTAPGALIPSDYAEAHFVDGKVATVTKEQMQGYYLNGSPGGGPTTIDQTIEDVLATATFVRNTPLKFSKPQNLVSSFLVRMDARQSIRTVHYKCPLLDGGSVVPDYYISANLSPNVCGSKATDWKTGTYATGFSLHDGDALCLWGRLFAVFDYDTNTWMMYNDVGSWEAV